MSARVQPKWSGKDASAYTSMISEGKKFSDEQTKPEGERKDYDENNPYYMAMDDKERKEAEVKKQQDLEYGVTAPDDENGFELDEQD